MKNSLCLDLFPNPGLPTQNKYQHFSKDMIKKKVGKEKELESYISEDSSYCVNPNMFALYDFKKEPLLGKYQSVIVDRKEGIVLSKRSSKAHFHDLLKYKLLMGLTFQKEIARRLGYKDRHVISTGKLAYFSIRGYTKASNDWVSLHLMDDYQILGNRSIRFKSIELNGVTYTFTFANCCRHIRSKIAESLRHNNVVFKVSNYHLKHTMGWPIYRLRGKKSLLDKEEYFTPHPAIEFFTMKEICADLMNQKHSKYGKTMAEFFRLDFMKEDHKLIHRLSQRDDSLF